MEVCQFKEFLINCKLAIGDIPTAKPLHIVLGNESCDLDSTSSTLALAYFLHIKYLNSKRDVLVLPILNISSEDFFLRTLNCFVLSKIEINKNWLIYRNDFDLAGIDKTKLDISLVDHHVLLEKDVFLKDNIREVIDHRPLDLAAPKWVEGTDVCIIEVGSCSTLVAQKFFEADFVMNEKVGLLLYDAIIFDTAALADSGKTKELDKIIIRKLKTSLDITSENKQIYEKLWEVHTDVSHLTPKQLLSRDLKFVESVPVPGLPMLVARYLDLPEAVEAVKSFANDRNVEVVVLVGIEVKDCVKRDIAIFTSNSNNLVKLLIYNFINSEIGTGEKLQLVRENLKSNVIYFRQENINASRKQIVPLIKKAVLQSQRNSCDCNG